MQQGLQGDTVQVAALHSFGDDAHVTGKWSVYVGKHNDCTADDGHPDAFSRAFQMNGPAAEMSRTRSTIGYGPSKGPGRKAALLTIRNVAPRQIMTPRSGAHSTRRFWPGAPAGWRA